MVLLAQEEGREPGSQALAAGCFLNLGWKENPQNMEGCSQAFGEKVLEAQLWAWDFNFGVMATPSKCISNGTLWPAYFRATLKGTSPLEGGAGLLVISSPFFFLSIINARAAPAFVHFLNEKKKISSVCSIPLAPNSRRSCWFSSHQTLVKIQELLRRTKTFSG